MLTIRLQRTGARNQSSFRIVLAEAHRAASKKYLEVLGHYNPRSKNFGIKDQARLKYWLEQNVNISPTVRNLLVDKKLLAGSKVKAWAPKKKIVSTEPAAAVPASAPTLAQPSVGESKAQESSTNQAAAS